MTNNKRSAFILGIGKPVSNEEKNIRSLQKVWYSFFVSYMSTEKNGICIQIIKLKKVKS
jgi:hypothetical protein